MLWTSPAAGAPPDPCPPAGAGLAELIEARDAGSYRWPRARAELQEILADRLRLRAALADTVSALRYHHRLDQIAAASREDSLRSVIRWQGWDLEAAHARRQRWYQSPSVVVPLTVLATIWAVDVVVGR
jgi:hypothetical protein